MAFKNLDKVLDQESLLSAEQKEEHDFTRKAPTRLRWGVLLPCSIALNFGLLLIITFIWFSSKQRSEHAYIPGEIFCAYH